MVVPDVCTAAKDIARDQSLPRYFFEATVYNQDGGLEGEKRYPGAGFVGKLFVVTVARRADVCA